MALVPQVLLCRTRKKCNGESQQDPTRFLLLSLLIASSAQIHHYLGHPAGSQDNSSTATGWWEMKGFRQHRPIELCTATIGVDMDWDWKLCSYEEILAVSQSTFSYSIKGQSTLCVQLLPIFWGWLDWLSEWLFSFTIPPGVEGSLSPHPWEQVLLLEFLILTTLIV